MDPHKEKELLVFMKMCKQGSSVPHSVEMSFLKEWVESMVGKVPPATHQIKSEEDTKEEKTVTM